VKKAHGLSPCYQSFSLSQLLNGGLEVKILVFALMLGALSVGLARPTTSYANDNCINNNSKACRDARSAFAEHHDGVYPRQYRAEVASTHHHHHWHRALRNDQRRDYR
jgi:hypothetical protein